MYIYHKHIYTLYHPTHTTYPLQVHTTLLPTQKYLSVVFFPNFLCAPFSTVETDIIPIIARIHCDDSIHCIIHGHTARRL